MYITVLTFNDFSCCINVFLFFLLFYLSEFHWNACVEKKVLQKGMHYADYAGSNLPWPLFNSSLLRYDVQSIVRLRYIIRYHHYTV